jgi:hypothetical protein
MAENIVQTAAREEALDPHFAVVSPNGFVFHIREAGMHGWDKSARH